MERYYATYGEGKVSVDGVIHMSGPQAVGGNGGISENIAQVFRANSDVSEIYIQLEHDSISSFELFHRIDERDIE